MTKISQLPPDSSPSTTDYVPALDVETMTTRRITLANILSLFFNNIPSAAVTPAKWTNPYKFCAYMSSSVSVASNGIIPYANEIFDSNNNFSTSTYKYTVPVSGFYLIGATAYIVSENSQPWIGLYKNGSKMSDGMILPTVGSQNCAVNVQGLYQLTAGDTIEVRRFNAAASAKNIYGTLAGLESMFYGHLVSQT